MSDETEAETTPTYDKRKLWKLALLCVPAVISGVSSYAKSSTEATDQAKATFEHIETDIDALQADMLKYREASFVLSAQVTVLKEQLDAANKRAEDSRHWAAAPAAVSPVLIAPAATGGTGGGGGLSGLGHRKPKPGGDDGMKTEMMMAVEKPSFDSVVKAYKSKK